MANLSDVILYIYKKYPSKDELSQSRLIWMIYLVDWKFAINYGSQLTNVNWSIDDEGPHPDNQTLDSILDNFFRLKEKKAISLHDTGKLSPSEREVVDFVIKSSASKSWNEFTRLIYSTYPVITERKSEKPDLVKSAKKYKQIKPLLARELNQEPPESYKELEKCEPSDSE